MAGSLQSPAGLSPCYSGLFNVDLDSGSQYRMENEANRICCKEIMVTLHAILDANNPCAQLIKHIKYILAQNDSYISLGVSWTDY